MYHLPIAIGLLVFVPALADPPVGEIAVIESSLDSAGPQIRQFAFDGDPATYFASAKNPSTTDHLTLRFDNPVKVKSILIQSGTPKNESLLSTGVLETSTDGIEFVTLGAFYLGKISVKKELTVKAIRIRPTKDLKTPLVIREITIDSEPKLLVFRYPIEITMDVTDAPTMKEWCEKVIRVCEREYPIICEGLMSPGYHPMTQIKLVMKSDYDGVAKAGGGKITGSAKFFKDNPNDIGAMVHETVHCVQNYKSRMNPGWLVEGIADYYRFWVYEPGKAGPVNPDKASYDDSYRVTATFLAYVSDKYEPKLVNKLNAVLREGKYDVAVWKTLTKKTIEELNQEWRQSLAK